MTRRRNTDSDYVRGDHWLIDDRSGEKIRSSDAVREWDGTIVHRDDAEPRHPQDFVRAKRDRQAVRVARPPPPDVFRGPPETTVSTAGAAGDTGLEVASSVDFNVNDRFSVMLDNGEAHVGIVTSVADSTHIAFTGEPLAWSVAAGALVSNLSRTPTLGGDL